MIIQLRHARRFNETILLLAFSTMCLVLSIVRVFYSASPTFLFLNWNLFLAVIPWALSFALIYDIGDRFINPFEHPRKWGVALFMGLFLNVVYWSLRLIKYRKHYFFLNGKVSPYKTNKN